MFFCAFASACLPQGCALFPQPVPPELPEEPDAGELSGVTPRPAEPTETDNPPQVVAALTRSAAAKIDAALTDGGIDLAHAALFHQYAQFAPYLLPQELQSDPDVTLPPPNDHAWASLAEQSRAQLTAAEQQNLDALTARPGSPAFRNFSNLAPTTGTRCLDTIDNADAQTRVVAQTQHYTFHVVATAQTSSGLSVADQLNSLELRVTGELGTPVDNVGAVSSRPTFSQWLDAVFDFYRTTGFPASTARDVVANNGRIPVYVLDCAGMTDDAGADQFGNIYVSFRLAMADRALRRVVLPHETVHVFTEGTPARGPHQSWPFEAMAVALEDVVARDVKRWSRVPASDALPENRDWFVGMNRSFRCPEEPFHSANRGPCAVDRSGPSVPGREQGAYVGNYSKFVFFKWHQRKSGGSPSVLAAWWADFNSRSGVAENIVSADDLADFQYALLGDEYGRQTWFEDEDRARFDDPAAALDLDPKTRRRYTFRFEEEKYWSNKGRVAPPVESSTGAPRVPSNATWPLRPGATQRILIEVPKLPVMESFPGLPSLVWKHSGPKPVLRFHYVDGPAKNPTRKYLPFDAQLAMAQDGELYFSSTAPRTLVVTATAPPGMAAELTLEWGVTMGAMCVNQCGHQYKPAFDACCPDVCDDSDCLAACLARTPYERSLSGFCADYCWGSAEPYPSRFEGQDHATTAPKMCTAGGVSSCGETPSGLVPLSSWVDVTCMELGMY